MFMIGRQYRQDVSYSQLDLQIQCNHNKKKFPASSLVDINKLIPRCIWRGKRPRMALKERNKVGGLILPDFKTYYKAAATKTCGIGKRIDRSMEQNRAQK